LAALPFVAWVITGFMSVCLEFPVTANTRARFRDQVGLVITEDRPGDDARKLRDLGFSVITELSGGAAWSPRLSVIASASGPGVPLSLQSIAEDGVSTCGLFPAVRARSACLFKGDLYLSGGSHHNFSRGNRANGASHPLAEAAVGLPIRLMTSQSRINQLKRGASRWT
jgi:hypothetical protein